MHILWRPDNRVIFNQWSDINARNSNTIKRDTKQRNIAFARWCAFCYYLSYMHSRFQIMWNSNAQVMARQSCCFHYLYKNPLLVIVLCRCSKYNIYQFILSSAKTERKWITYLMPTGLSHERLEQFWQNWQGIFTSPDWLECGGQRSRSHCG